MYLVFSNGCQFTTGGVETTGKVATVEMLLHRSRSMSLST